MLKPIAIISVFCLWILPVTSFLYRFSRYSKFKCLRLKMVSARIPQSYIEVEKEMTTSLNRAIESTSGRMMLRIDVLTPGLNPKLEQKAMLTQDYLFDLVVAVLPTLVLRFKHIKILFPSIGDAAGFQKYCNQRRSRLGMRVFL
jgi:hypothetical protein